MPCSDPLPSAAESDWMRRHERSARQAMELLCSGDPDQLRGVLGGKFDAWLQEHKVLDRMREAFRAASSYHVI